MYKAIIFLPEVTESLIITLWAVGIIVTYERIVDDYSRQQTLVVVRTCYDICNSKKYNFCEIYELNIPYLLYIAHSALSFFFKVTLKMLGKITFQLAHSEYEIYPLGTAVKDVFTSDAFLGAANSLENKMIRRLCVRS